MVRTIWWFVCMKSRDYIIGFYVVVIVCIACNCLFIWYFYCQQKEEKLLCNELKQFHEKEYEFAINRIESGLILRHIASDDKMLAGKFVIAFPDNVCDVCNTWLFSELSELKSETEIATVIPSRLKKTIETYNSMYNLGLFPIYYTEQYILLDESLKDLIYIFYCSESGKILYPLILRKDIMSLKLYIDIVKVIDTDFQ